MLIVPFRETKAITMLPMKEVIERLSRSLDPPGTGLWSIISGGNKNMTFYGEVTENGFWAYSAQV